jgi:peptide/nickel transport system ATP-binding protein
MRRIRGDRISMIFQEPMTSLNPVLTIGRQIAETVVLHQKLDRHAARARAIEMLRLVQIAEPERRVDEYPHQLSGGMRQRVMIAMALACNPKLLIADEPTTALDVTIQAEILDLLNELKDRFGMAVLLITHDLGVVAGTAQRVIVMYAGQIVEEASVEALFEDPLHPYTQGLLRSIPRVDRAATTRQRLSQIPGTVPILRGELRACCRFAPRCSFAKPSHFGKTPPLKEVRSGHKTACFLYD